MSNTETLKRPDLDPSQFEGMEIPCDLKIALVYATHTGPIRPCHNPARWVGFYPCCGKHALVCDEHHGDENPYFCNACKKNHANLINWSRL